MKPLYAVSASVGSGKTVAAVQYIAQRATATRDFIYVAPTIRLLDQTAGQLRTALIDHDSVRSIHLIHSEANLDEGHSATKEALLVINERPTGLGRVVLLTTKTFLKVLPCISEPERWGLILDEAFAPVTFINYHLGQNPEEGMDYFREMFVVDPADNYRVLPVSGRVGLVEQIASAQLDHCGQRYLGQRDLAQAVSNPAMRCELVVTGERRAVDPMRATTDEAFPGLADARSLLFACYVTPDHFGMFRETIILSALFEHTVLHHLWSRCFGVRFVDHPWFSAGILRNVHVEQGPMVSVGHLLHQTDRASKHNLFSNRNTGKPGEDFGGGRVLDAVIENAAEFLKGSSFLLQTNNGTGYGPGGALLPDGAVPIPVVSHGLNQFMDADNIVALAVTNPNPQEAEWVQTRTGLTKDQVLQAYRIHTVYQAVGRTSIRFHQRSGKRKVFLVAGYDDARLLHQLFRGSTWLGQVGGLPPLRNARETQSAPGSMTRLARAIVEYLDALPPEVETVSSRSVKARLAPEVASSTWTEAARQVTAHSVSWRKSGHRFCRVLFSDFFEVDDDDAQCSETHMNNQKTYGSICEI